MKKEDNSSLLQRYLSAHDSGKEPYFDADELVELLDSFEESDDYEYFDDVLALGLKLHPGNIDIQIRQCRYYIYNEEYDCALALVDSIGETNNQDLDLIVLECYCMLDQYDKAKMYIEQLTANKCEYLENVYEFMATILNELDMDDESYDLIKQGLELFPENLLLKEEIIYSLEAKEDYEEAIKICNEMIDKNPYSHNFWNTLGRLYSYIDEYDKAIEALDFALTCNDSDTEVKILKAYCHYMNENYEKALELYKEILSNLKPNTHINLYNIQRVNSLLAECYMKIDDYENGYFILKDLIDNHIVIETTPYIDLIRCCTETDREKEASDMLLLAAKRFPNDVRLLSLLAMTYVENDEDELAIETTERLFEVLDTGKSHMPDDCKSLIQAGQFLFMKGEVDKALKYYKKVLEINPKTLFIHLHIAMIYLAKGDMKRFSEHFSKTTPEELMKYLEETGFDFNNINLEQDGKNIPSEDLVKEFLKNKDNNN